MVAFCTRAHVYRISLVKLVLFAFFRNLVLNFDVINLKWVDPFHIVAISSDERLHVVDIALGETAEEDISFLELVYGTAEFKVHPFLKSLNTKRSAFKTIHFKFLLFPSHLIVI